eukprot:3931763-Rhodomonas_salina.1
MTNSSGSNCKKAQLIVIHTWLGNHTQESIYPSCSHENMVCGCQAQCHVDVTNSRCKRGCNGLD